MSEISRVALFGKLNSLGYKAIEGATVFCKLRGNPYVELVHWIQQILQAQDSDLQRIVRYFELDVGKLAGDITAALDRLPRGATSISDLSEAVENAVERGWVYGSLMYRESHVRTGHLIVGALKTPSLRNALMAISRQFERIRGDTLTEDFEKIVAGSPEEALAANDGSGAAANLLKPVLARGTLRTIGATTFAEYKRYIEKDPALTRRFQSIQVDEPSEAKALLMMRGVATTMESHHKVQILDEALESAVKLSHRYIPARQLPDKAVSLLDTTSARVAVSLHATPAEVDDSRKRISGLETELEIINREKDIGLDVTEREAAASEALAAERARLAELDARWSQEKALVDEVLALRGKLRGSAQPVEGTGSKVEAAAAEVQSATPSADAAAEAPPDRDALLARLHVVQTELADLQGEHPLILPTVDHQAVASVVADWTGIPVGRMARNEIETVLNLPRILAQRIIGQDHAMEMIARRIQTSRAGLDNPNKPIGVFMLAGTSGVGKTETALALAEALYGGEQNVITINMSEYQEAHTVSTLKGAPPGYVGYGEGGVLTEAVRRRPYSVVLLDEVEKAHPDVHEIFFQVFDKGWMEDGEGRVINFKNTLILLTTNAGTELITSLCKDPDLMPDAEGMAKALREPLLKVFPPALLGRLVVIPYYPLNDEMIGAIARLQLGRIAKRVRENHRVPFNFDDAVIKLIASRCTELESGGRMIDAILTNTMLPRISEEFLRRMLEGKPIERVHVGVEGNDFQYSFD